MGVSKCFVKTSRVFMSVSEVFQGYFNFLGFLKVVLFLNKGQGGLVFFKVLS